MFFFFFFLSLSEIFISEILIFRIILLILEFLQPHVLRSRFSCKAQTSLECKNFQWGHQEFWHHQESCHHQSSLPQYSNVPYPHLWRTASLEAIVSATPGTRPAAQKSSLFPCLPSGCCKLQPSRRLPTVQFVSLVKSNPITISQAFSVPYCPSRHVTVLPYHRIAKENCKTCVLQ